MEENGTRYYVRIGKRYLRWAKQWAFAPGQKDYAVLTTLLAHKPLADCALDTFEEAQIVHGNLADYFKGQWRKYASDAAFKSLKGLSMQRITTEVFTRADINRLSEPERRRKRLRALTNTS